MDAVFKKLNYKDHLTVYVLKAPASFQIHLDSITDTAIIKTDLKGASEVEFAIIFVTKQQEINETIPAIGPLLKGDAVLWVCYPKGTSKKYQCDFNRDTGWAILGDYSLEGVRQVAIDEDWSALRFRKVAYIKTLTRKFGALSEAGRKKSGQ